LTITIAPQALKEIAEAHSFIATDNRAAAARLLERLNQVIRQLAGGELSGPRVRLRRGGIVRRWSVPPYRIYYRRTRDQLRVLRVYHQARRSIEL
jgi:plasmid stabilization system protein ParE